MPRRIIDISVPLKAGIASDPPQMAPQIEYLDHHATAPAPCRLLRCAGRCLARRRVLRHRALRDLDA